MIVTLRTVFLLAAIGLLPASIDYPGARVFAAAKKCLRKGGVRKRRYDGYLRHKARQCAEEAQSPPGAQEAQESEETQESEKGFLPRGKELRALAVGLRGSLLADLPLHLLGGGSRLEGFSEGQGRPRLVPSNLRQGV